MNIIFVGPPGAGKGTQAQVISKTFKIPHISTGDMLRSEMESGSELGNKVRDIINSGKLVDDAVMNQIVKERLSKPDTKNGFILDGFPRTLNQAKSLDGILSSIGKKIDYVIYVDVPEKIIVERLSARRMCPKCGRNYNMITDPPKEDELCDDCHVPLITRDDDKPETVRNRYKVYLELTKPVIDYYSAKKLLFTVDGTLPVKEVEKILIKMIEGNK
ncbi:MAG: adenylate kinase [Mesoaciditoga sp.]|uniref:adenylate kinase n=1 Tax=Athalassotoga sp. TaxID=2022597 RepID=UPI000CB748ED|nr:MAG: adenylate kinase [Mesoaciditoga sp.]PMP79888.1 MAG: adenylate kinase [Mesoaciditoga sp.]HEU23682.1 adenylate kinase [Mesoaciditoga lauensis]